jgi:REP element-mobilizing transposase RayT
MEQLEMKYPVKYKWGGYREGAGRPARTGKKPQPHSARPEHRADEPVHVTLRAVRQVASLRRWKVGAAIGEAIRAATMARTVAGFRVIHFSIQPDHLHLIVEADGKRALSRGTQALAIRIARAVNRALGRRGRVFSDRYHARALASPREVRNAIAYVINNWYKHVWDADGVDSFSSGRWFDGWAGRAAPTQRTRSPVAEPRTWLARVGWRRFHPLIDPWEKPRSLEGLPH